MRDLIYVLEKSALFTMTNCLFQFVTVILTTITHLPWEHNWIANLSNVKLNNNITIKIIDIVCKTLGTIVFEMINYCCLIFVIASNTLHTPWIVATVLKQLGCHLHFRMWKHCVACFFVCLFVYLFVLFSLLGIKHIYPQSGGGVKFANILQNCSK